MFINFCSNSTREFTFLSDKTMDKKRTTIILKIHKLLKNSTFNYLTSKKILKNN